MRFAERLFRSSRASAAEPDPSLWVGGHSRLEPLAFRRAPALWAAFWFCLGIWASRFVWQPTLVLVVGVALLPVLVVAGLGRGVRTEWVRLVPLAALWVAGGLICGEIQPAPPMQAGLRGYADGLSRAVHGRVVRVRVLAAEMTAENADVDGYEEQEAAPNLSVDVAVDAVEEITPEVSRMVPVSGGVRITVLADGAAPAFRCGDRVEAAMLLRLPARYRDPGAWQYADYLLGQGVGAHASVHGNRIVVGPSGGRWRLEDVRCHVYAVQGWASGRMLGYARSTANRRLPRMLRLSLEDAGMLNAMLFGDRAGLNHELRVGFERTGSFHLFVVSGMHVGLIALGLFWLARRVRLPMWAATLVTIALTVAYAALTGFGVPVQRALWMATVFLLARLLDRGRNTLNAFGLAILAVLVWSPSSLFEASFQMTFLAIVGVVGIALPIGERTILPYAHAARKLDDVWLDIRFEPRLAQFRVMLRVIGEPIGWLLGRRFRNVPAWGVRGALWGLELCLIGVVTEAVMSLPMAVYFHRATLFALPANLVSVPVIGLLVPAALATFSMALLSSWAAVVPGAVAGLMLHGITGAVGRIAQAQLADYRVPEPAAWVCLPAAGALGFCFWSVRRRGEVWGWLSAAALPLVVILVLWPSPPVRSLGVLEVTALDVGQGDSLLVVGPGGRSMLIDAGGPIGGQGGLRADQSSGFDVGEEVVAPYLWSRRIRRLDVVALTHEHSDHMGGMPAILRDFRPRELWVGADVPSTAYRDLLGEAAKLGVVVRHFRAGDALAWDDTRISVLGPEAEYTNRGSPRNDDSLVLRMQFGAASVLLEGDAERPEERAMLLHERIEPVTLLKVGHHGSSTSSTEELLAAASPRDAVISSGKGNPFGHPRAEVVARFTGHGIKLYRTDMFGLTTFLLDRDGGIRELAETSNELQALEIARRAR